MKDFDIQLDLKPSQASLDELADGLNEHSLQIVEKAGFQPIAFFARDNCDRLQGGIYGRINWNWLRVSLLWVSPDNRGSGLGSELLNKLESEATTRGCVNSHVDTFSFQAREFYLTNGYAVFAELPDYPAGHSRIYLKKSL
ncbi:MAG: GNAT family N-acetyltransferase [Woeseiaceae bacterium]